MKISDVQFPAPLLSALRDGSLVVFAGAGVSAGEPASIHEFSALVEAIAQGTGQARPANESEDVFLGRLQHRGVLVHDIAAKLLLKNRFDDIPKPTSLHHDLLRLYPEPGAVRIVTTNFDLLFASAAQEVFTEQPEAFRAPALPLGHNFNGIVHLHGCLDRPREMVLTDADFGRAYLTEGWARRFLVELFNSSTVMFVGYSHNDTVMKYLARALPARESERRFALTGSADDNQWPVLGIEPISYPQESDIDHSSLNEGMRGLAHYAGCGLLDWRQEITEIARRSPPSDEREADIIDEALDDATRAQFFADAATHPEWLDWLDRRGHLAPQFGAADLTDPNLPIAEWMVDRFAFDHPQALFRLVGRHDMTLHPYLWHRLAQVIAFPGDRGLSNELLSRWVSCLLSTAPPLQDRHQLLYLAHHCNRVGLVVPLVELFEAIAGHGLSLRPPFPGLDDEFSGHPDLPAEDIDVELIPDGNDGVFRKLWQTVLTPRLDSVAEPLLSIAISSLAVEDIEVKRAEEAAVSRKARNRRAGGRPPEPDTGAAEPEYSVHITARTDDGRRVAFRHDEIRDWHDNIRLDYGYAMTIASAQGLTVDRAFLLLDDRPARETIYPAATRHREALDVYVNRAPLAFDIAEHRPEDEADRPVLDSDVRAWLAERWSRSVPKEAALDYVSGGMWRDAREEAPRHGRGGRETHRDAANASEAANDNFRERIARDIRHAVNGWRHGGRVRGRAQRGSGGLGRPSRARPGRGRCRCAHPRLPRDPRPPRRADEAGRVLQGPSPGFRAASLRARRNRRRRAAGAA